MKIVHEEHGKVVDSGQKVDLHSVKMGNEHYTTSNKWGNMPLKTVSFHHRNLMKKHACVAEEEES